MVEDKSVVEQSNELQMISQDVRSKGIRVDEQMQVSTIIDKLPESWKEFAKVLRHKQKELSIESLSPVWEWRKRQGTKTKLWISIEQMVLR